LRLFKRRKEKQQQKQKEGHEMMRKEEEEQCTMEKRGEHKDVDIAKLGPVPIAGDEQSLYRYNIAKGTFRTKVIASYFVTNYRIMTLLGP
jgi:hypothetical protein